MGLASIANIPDSPESLDQWAFSHMAHHRDIIRRVRELSGIRLDEYSLDPFPAQNTGVWGYQHQQMHNQMNAVLGIQGDDLTEVTWGTPGDRASWIFTHFAEHQQAGAILEV